MERLKWGVYRVTETTDRYVEEFLIASWAEHLRHHARQTHADRDLEDRLASLVQGELRVRHLIYAPRSTRRS